MHDRTARRQAGVALLVGATYFVVARASRAFIDPETAVAVIWPLSGLMLALLLLSPRRLWPALLAGAAAGSFAVSLATGLGVGLAVGLALANTVETSLGALVVQRIAGVGMRASEVRSTAALLAGGVGVGCAAGGVVAATALALDTESAWPAAFGSWWAADALGIVAAAPLAFSVAARHTRPFRLIESTGPFERFIAIAGTAAMSAMVFLDDGGPFDTPLLVIPFMAVAAIRLGWADTGIVVALFSGFAAIGTVEGQGPFVTGGVSNAELLAAQISVAVLGATALIVAAITAERSEALEGLDRERADMAEAQRLARVGSWSFDLETGESEWSAQQFINFGLEPREGKLGPADFLSVIHPDDVERVRKVMRGEEALEHGFEFRVVRPDGEVAILETWGARATTPEGRKVLTGTTRDVTDERQAALALGAAEERFRRAFEDSGAGMAMISVANDTLDRFIDANQAMARLVGLSRAELIGTLWWDRIDHDDLAAVAGGITGLFTGERDSFSSELRLLTVGGQTCWATCTISLVRDPDGKVLHALLQAQDITERKRFEGQLQFLADHDALTGLVNRRRFEAELEREISRVERYGGEGAVLVLDLDHFKPVNDTAGHAIGDQILVTVADVLRARLRSTDVIGRLGGDEFGVIVPETDRAAATQLASELRAVVAARMRRSGNAIEARVTASVGVATFAAGDEGLTPEELLIEADLAMYAAKEAGRDRVRVHETGKSGKREARAGWVTRIREAIEQGQFVLHAQPILPIVADDDRPRYELLLRMVAGQELIVPGTFLYVAERFGLMPEIDRWVIGEAARVLAGHQGRGAEVVFHINLSATSVTDPELAERIASELRAHDASPEGLVFEMTETEAIVNIDLARSFAQEVRELGCGFALDDFGAGFASFYYLKHLAFDYLKIDGEFIENIVTDQADRTVVSALVRIAEGLGKRTIAERVGDEATVRLLRELGVDYGQGYHLGRPRPLPDLNVGEPAATG